MKRAALYFEARSDGRVACGLCPNDCIIAEGKHGLCKVRFNRGGLLDIPFYGRISAIAVDPIEKKPLYHYHPGSRILSVGFVGCSFHCGFCQNWHISQSTDTEIRSIDPEDLVRTALREQSFGIAYTYSEPLIHVEYVMDTARIARANGLKNVLVSNGYIKPEPAQEVLGLIDAANIDLKGFDPDFYQEETGGKLEEVKRFISQAAMRTHLEITTLVIPGRNDDPKQIEGIARFIAGLDPFIPLHLSCYYPQYHYEIPATPYATVRKLADVARKYLRFVYLGNVDREESNTMCPSCGSVLVRRIGYSTKIEGVADGKCQKCGAASHLVLDHT